MLRAEAVMTEKKCPPTLEEYVAAGYDPSTYDKAFPEDVYERRVTYFLVRNQARGRITRSARRAQPRRSRSCQYLFGDASRRLRRGRDLRVPLQALLKNAKDVLERAAAGLITVHSMDGRQVDVAKLLAGQVLAAPRVPVNNTPQRALDSAALDAASGIPFPSFVDGTFDGDPAGEQVAASMAAEKLEEAAQAGVPTDTVVTTATFEDPAGDPADDVPAADSAEDELAEALADMDAEETAEEVPDEEAPVSEPAAVSPSKPLPAASSAKSKKKQKGKR